MGHSNVTTTAVIVPTELSTRAIVKGTTLSRLEMLKRRAEARAPTKPQVSRLEFIPVRIVLGKKEKKGKSNLEMWYVYIYMHAAYLLLTTLIENLNGCHLINDTHGSIGLIGLVNIRVIVYIRFFGSRSSAPHVFSLGCSPPSLCFRHRSTFQVRPVFYQNLIFIGMWRSAQWILTSQEKM
jgi:hypothetical protein